MLKTNAARNVQNKATEKNLLLFFSSANLSTLLLAENTQLGDESQNKKNRSQHIKRGSIEVQLISQRKEESSQKSNALMIFSKKVIKTSLK